MQIQTKKSSQIMVEIANWVPKMAALNLVWLVSSLPIITLFRSTRSAMLVLSELQTNVHQPIRELFKKIYQSNERRYDRIGSLLFMIAGVNVWFLLQQPTAWTNRLGYALMFAMIGFVVFCSWRVLLSKFDSERSFLLAFMIAGRNLLVVVTQLLSSLILIGLFMGLFSGVFIIIGGVGLMTLNTVLVEKRLRRKFNI
jgi:uncharacterized membrane protein YesL